MFKVYGKIKSAARKIIFHDTESLGYVFMFHRVGKQNKNNLAQNENMKVDPDFLYDQLRILTDRYDCIHMKDLPERLAKKADRKFIVFTFDDGYKDNLTEALPIFRAHNVPFTVFVSANFPEQNAVLWWYELENLVLSNNFIKLSNGKTYICGTTEEKNSAFMKIRDEILKLDQTDFIGELNRLFTGYSIDWYSQCGTLCMTWDDVNELVQDPLVTIGAHTVHHYNLKRLENTTMILNEISEGISLIKRHIHCDPFCFAYPFGSVNEVGDREIQMLSRTDIDLAFLSYGGDVTIRNGKYRYALPRIMFTNSFSAERMH